MYKMSDLSSSPARFLRISVGILLVFLVLPNLSVAMDLRAGRRISVPVEEVVAENLYAAAGELTVAGVVNADLVAAGGDVFLPGKVIHDASIAGGQVQLGGFVGGDLRVVGGRVDLTGE